MDTNEIPDGMQLTPFDETFYENPYEVYRRLRELDPIHKDIETLYPSSWTITEYALTKKLLRHPDLSVDPRKIGIARDPRADNAVTRRVPDMMNLDDPDHRRLRKLVEHAFTRERVEQFKPKIEAIATELLTQMQSGDLDIVANYAKPLPTIVIAEFLGVDRDMHPQFKRWTDTLLMQGYPMPTEQQWRDIVAADSALRAYVADKVEQRRIDLQDDFISDLIQAQIEDQTLSDDEIVDMCYLLIGAGNFTTTDLISNTYLALLQHDDQRHRLAEDLSGNIANAVEEALRYDSPPLVSRRYALADIEVDGVTIEKGSVVTLVLAAANHDPAVFEDPDTFNISRERKPHVSFAFGMHHCLGAMLARLETQVAIRRLMEKFPNASLLRHRRNKNFMFRGCSELWINTA